MTRDELLADYLDTLSTIENAGAFGLVFALQEDKAAIASWFERRGYTITNRYTDSGDSIYLSGVAFEVAAKATPRLVQHSHIFILTDEEYRDAPQTEMVGPVCDTLPTSV